MFIKLIILRLTTLRGFHIVVNKLIINICHLLGTSFACAVVLLEDETIGFLVVVETVPIISEISFAFVLRTAFRCALNREDSPKLPEILKYKAINQIMLHFHYIFQSITKNPAVEYLTK